MSLTLATSKAVVRRKCGGVDTTELSDSDLEAMFTNEALQWINKRRPKVVIRSFTTVTDQQDYDEKPSNAYYIGHVWWKAVSWTTFDPTMQFLPGALDVDDQLAGFDVLSAPDLVEAFYKKIAHYDDFFQGTGEETSEGKIRLMPEPTDDDDTVYFESAEPRWSSIANVETQYVEAIEYFVASLAMEYLAVKRGVIRSGRDWSGGGGANEMKKAEEYRLIAEGLVPEAVVFRRM